MAQQFYLVFDNELNLVYGGEQWSAAEKAATGASKRGEVSFHVYYHDGKDVVGRKVRVFRNGKLESESFSHISRDEVEALNKVLEGKF